MLLIGMKISFTKKPTNPITTNPIAVRNATFVNSATKYPNFSARSTQIQTKSTNVYILWERERERERDTFAIGLVAALNKADTVLGEVSEGIDDWVNGVHFSDSVCVRERERERERERARSEIDNWGFVKERENWVFVVKEKIWY